MALLLPCNSQVIVFPEDRARIKNKKKPFEEQSIIAKISTDLCKYYAKFIELKYGFLLEHANFGGHVTINNGLQQIDIKKHEEFLNALNKTTIKIKYDPNFYVHWKFIALRVQSPEFSDIRKHLGLNPEHPFHITLGKIPDYAFEDVKTRPFKTCLNYPY